LLGLFEYLLDFGEPLGYLSDKSIDFCAGGYRDGVWTIGEFAAALAQAIFKVIREFWKVFQKWFQIGALLHHYPTPLPLHRGSVADEVEQSVVNFTSIFFGNHAR